MECQLKDTYVWFELKKGFIPANVEAEIRFHLLNVDMSNPKIKIFETDQNYYIRTFAQFKKGRYYCTFLTQPWKSLNYHVYLEINKNNKTEIILSRPGQVVKTIEKFQFGLLTTEDTCLIGGIKYLFKSNDWMIPGTLYSKFMLIPKK